MTKPKQSITENLIREYFWNRTSQEAECSVRDWLVSDVHKEEKENILWDIWNSYHIDPDKKTLEALDKVSAKLGFPSKTSSNKSYLSRRILLRVAAVIIPLVIIAGITFQFLKTPTIESDIHEELFAMEIAEGESRNITLPDGTELWLNSASSLTYSETEEGERLVSLCGEAYFSVAKKEGRPFIVKTEHLSIIVLGTQFNVKAYPDSDETVVVLDEGLVSILTENNLTQNISPGEFFSYNNSTSNMTSGLTPEDIPDWRSMVLTFDYATFDHILNAIENYYQKTITVTTFPSETALYSVRFSGKEPLEQVMQIMQDVTGGFSYVINDDLIINY